MSTRQWILVIAALAGLAFVLSWVRWFGTHEYVATWLEGIALVAIFGMDYFERKEKEEESNRLQRETIEQLKLSREQVEATRMSVRAMINIERPLLVITWSSDPNAAGIYRFGCRNQGKTTAKVTSVSAALCFVSKPEALELPPKYTSPTQSPDLTIIVGEDSFPIGKGLNPQAYIDSHGKGEAITNSREFLVYYGNVLYRDTLYPASSDEGLHESRWCFIYQPHGERKFVRSGPEEYHLMT